MKARSVSERRVTSGRVPPARLDCTRIAHRALCGLLHQEGCCTGAAFEDLQVPSSLSNINVGALVSSCQFAGTEAFALNQFGVVSPNRVRENCS